MDIYSNVNQELEKRYIPVERFKYWKEEVVDNLYGGIAFCLKEHGEAIKKARSIFTDTDTFVNLILFIPEDIWSTYFNDFFYDQAVKEYLLEIYSEAYFNGFILPRFEKMVKEKKEECKLFGKPIDEELQKLVNQEIEAASKSKEVDTSNFKSWFLDNAWDGLPVEVVVNLKYYIPYLASLKDERESDAQKENFKNPATLLHYFKGNEERSELFRNILDRHLITTNGIWNIDGHGPQHIVAIVKCLEQKPGMVLQLRGADLIRLFIEEFHYPMKTNVDNAATPVKPNKFNRFNNEKLLIQYQEILEPLLKN